MPVISNLFHSVTTSLERPLKDYKSAAGEALHGHFLTAMHDAAAGAYSSLTVGLRMPVTFAAAESSHVKGFLVDHPMLTKPLGATDHSTETADTGSAGSTDAAAGSGAGNTAA